MWLNAVRYGIPLVLVVAGIVFALVDHDGTGAETWAMFTGAGVSVLLLNFDEHGRWPD